VFAFAGSTCPTGSILADGSSLLRAGKYANLYSAIGTTWGSADGSHFTLPNLINRFLRGAGAATDGNGGVTVALGSFQNDAFQGHWHGNSGSSGDTANIVGNFGTGSPGIQTGGAGFTYVQITDPVSDGTNGTPRTSSETRPKAYGVNFCIKY
jgi:microcystin-dependent protein